MVLSLHRGVEDLEERTEPEHVEYDAHLGLHAGQRERSTPVLERVREAHERTQTGRVDVVDLLKVDDETHVALLDQVLQRILETNDGRGVNRARQRDIDAPRDVRKRGDAKLEVGHSGLLLGDEGDEGRDASPGDRHVTGVLPAQTDVRMWHRTRTHTLHQSARAIADGRGGTTVNVRRRVSGYANTLPAGARTGQ